MMEEKYLVSLETSGNQPYIFSSNKLRDVVGASELIYRVGTDFVKEAIASVKEAWTRKSNGSDPIKMVISTSGKAVLFADSQEVAGHFITEWSKLVAEKAPGIDAMAVYSRIPFDPNAPLDEPSSYMAAFRDVGKNYSLAKSGRAYALSRFQRIPLAASCRFSSFPAEGLLHDEPVSRVTMAKLDARNSDAFKNRMKALFPNERNAAIDANGLEKLEDMEWLGVVHADGNGLGQIFTKFHDYVKERVCATEGRVATGWDYIKNYGAFSDALDRISGEAFKETVNDIFDGSDGGTIAAIVPIVVGGDDLTVVLDGRKAIEFAKCFMENFCRKTSFDPDVSMILERCGDHSKRLGMCAGICINKPKFPFSASYQLAEELMQNAKKVKTEVGKDAIALDFHILYDSVTTSLADIRKKLQTEDDHHHVERFSKPFALSCGTMLTDRNPRWESAHNYDRFIKTVRALSSEVEKENGEREKELPSSQAYAIRNFLVSECIETQSANWRSVMDRHRGFAAKWEQATGTKELYTQMEDCNAQGMCGKNVLSTYFLDALEAVSFISVDAAVSDEGEE